VKGEGRERREECREGKERGVRRQRREKWIGRGVKWRGEGLLHWF